MLHEGELIVTRRVPLQLSARETNGSMRLSAENGPVGFTGSSGDVMLRSDNGPISVDLHNSFWERGTLDARTDNGPLAVRLPRGYRSGVIVDSDGHSPVKCRAADCRYRARTYEDDDDARWPRHIELGSGAVVVKVATHNGPVTIEDY